MAQTTIHPWEPIFDKNSKILILGSFPSPKSREFGFYYGHPQNIFWKVLPEVLKQPKPACSIEARKEFLLHNTIAIWDVLHSCKINGASDSSIKNPVPNKFLPIMKKSQISTILTTGRTATNLFNKLCSQETGVSPIYLPSTSPANRIFQAKPDFIAAWRQIPELLK